MQVVSFEPVKVERIIDSLNKKRVIYRFVRRCQ